jgi:hypothetical protein
MNPSVGSARTPKEAPKLIMTVFAVSNLLLESKSSTT